LFFMIIGKITYQVENGSSDIPWALPQAPVTFSPCPRNTTRCRSNSIAYSKPPQQGANHSLIPKFSEAVSKKLTLNLRIKFVSLPTFSD
jgi:hypothetical protein